MDIPKEAEERGNDIKSAMRSSLMANKVEEEQSENVDWLVNKLKPRFQWVCGKGGCGNCEVERIEFEYYRSETLEGELVESKTIPRLVSKCCKSELMMWDNEKDEEVDVLIDHHFAASRI